MECSLNATRTEGLDAGLELELHSGDYVVLSWSSGDVRGGAEEPRLTCKFSPTPGRLTRGLMPCDCKMEELPIPTRRTTGRISDNFIRGEKTNQRARVAEECCQHRPTG